MASKLDLVLQELKEQGKQIAVIQERQQNYQERMIGTDGHGGAIGFLYESIKKETEERKAAIEKERTERVAADTVLTSSVDGVKTRVNYAAGAVGTVGVLAGFVAKIGLSKLAVLLRP
jgi:hypothetical protein